MAKVQSMIRGVLPRGLAVTLVVAQAPGSSVTRLDRCLGAKPTARWTLPNSYREISGLALSDDGRLFFHNDERGIVGSLDLRSGEVVGNYELGPEMPKDDFEGIAIAGPRLFLLSSGGRLYESRTPTPGQATGTLNFRVTDTGLGAQCEFEGLAYDATSKRLLAVCKLPLNEALDGTVTIFQWSPDRNALGNPDRITIPLKPVAQGLQGKRFRPSGIERDPRTGTLLLVSSADYAIAEVDMKGRVIQSRSLVGKHQQAEGITLTANGDLIISDEGGKGRGTVTVYACR